MNVSNSTYALMNPSILAYAHKNSCTYAQVNVITPAYTCMNKSGLLSGKEIDNSSSNPKTMSSIGPNELTLGLSELTPTWCECHVKYFKEFGAILASLWYLSYLVHNYIVLFKV